MAEFVRPVLSNPSGVSSARERQGRIDLMPEDAKEAIRHRVRAKRSKSNAISFEIAEVETRHAAFQ
jgi:hypothetical protein